MAAASGDANAADGSGSKEAPNGNTPMTAESAEVNFEEFVGSFVDFEEAERLKRLAEALSTRADPSMAPMLRKMAPVARVASIGGQVMLNGASFAYGGLYSAYGRLPTNVANGFCGLGVCFFGGRYPATLAAVAAFRATGGLWASTHIAYLHQSMLRLQEANKEDDAKDENHDGIEDVLQISPQELAERKAALLQKNVDPTRIKLAVEALWSGFFGILSSLSFTSARNMTLAHSISETLRPTFSKFLAPTLLAVSTGEERKWVPTVLNGFSKVTGSVIAWKFGAVVPIFHSCVSGGFAFSRSVLQSLLEAGRIASEAKDGCITEIIGFFVAAAGLYYQLVLGAPVPSLVAPLFWPFAWTEASLMLCLPSVELCSIKAK